MYRLFLLTYLFFLSPLSSNEIRILYFKNKATPESPQEERLVEHVKLSMEKAERLKSKLTGKQFEETPDSKQWRNSFIPHYHPLKDIIKYVGYHLLNNLCALPGASHLHIGLLGGDSLISALYGNQSLLTQQVGVDWFKECSEPVFYSNCDQFLDRTPIQILNGECFKVDKSIFTKPIDIYFYDADHSLKAHENAFTYFNDIFADVFIAVIDDWKSPWIRGPTFKAFDKLGYSILYEKALSNSYLSDSGQYVAVIRKSPHAGEKTQAPPPFLKNCQFASLKNQVLQHVKNTWCSEEKANLIMELILETEPRICVEVGTFTGSSFLPIVSTLSFLGQGQAYAIDAWSNLEAVKGVPETDSSYEWWSRIDMQETYQSFLNTMQNPTLAPYYKTICASSAEAASQFDTIDFLHLDGNFSAQGALEDTLLYLPKVAPGGYILLSNLFYPVNGQFPKIKSLSVFLEQCEIVAEIDSNHTVLFQKKESKNTLDLSDELSSDLDVAQLSTGRHDVLPFCPAKLSLITEKAHSL